MNKKIQDLIEVAKRKDANIPLLVEDAYKRGFRDGAKSHKEAVMQFLTKE